jgi:hypothetical protein
VWLRVQLGQKHNFHIYRVIINSKQKWLFITKCEGISPGMKAVEDDSLNWQSNLGPLELPTQPRCSFYFFYKFNVQYIAQAFSHIPTLQGSILLNSQFWKFFCKSQKIVNLPILSQNLEGDLTQLTN